MNIQTRDGSPKNERGNGQLSYLLLQKGQFGAENMSVTWIDAAPGSEQKPHAHPSQEQAYIILEGKGLMKVGDEEAEVIAGSLVLVPPQTEHSIYNHTDALLRVLTVTAPPFDLSHDPYFSFNR